MITISLPAALQKLTGTNSAIEVRGQTLQLALDSLHQQHGALKGKILNDAGQIQRYVSIFIDGEDARYIGALNAPLESNSEIAILMAMAGG